MNDTITAALRDEFKNLHTQCRKASFAKRAAAERLAAINDGLYAIEQRLAGIAAYCSAYEIPLDDVIKAHIDACKEEGLL